ncbi:hypothetical protein [Rhizobium leguminosarum]|uniref:hypothetical protein n=1 Tax=Rhizobium leguminosarum TaxID=384 RepID=UPI001441D292|nr:hypothetical protein [Rhizobium leguminosarum]MBY5866004.1 hypothetical protein [Rhizobium leguminosarum]NKM07292.1 hypothetical protein [Rhizobium leguminosarum bv. viciae]
MADVLFIDSEDTAWRILKDILDNRIDSDGVILDFGNADWAKVHFNFKGSAFHQTVTASMMRGLLEYQYAFYRTAALILKDDSRINRLTDDNRRDLEFVFEVKEGSSDLLAGGVEQLAELGKSAISKMSGRQILIGLLVGAIVFCGGYTLNNHLDHEFELEKIDKDHQDKKDLYDFLGKIVLDNKEKTETLKRALDESAVAKEAAALNSAAIGEILRSNDNAEEISIQGTALGSKAIRELTRSSRSKSRSIMIRDTFTVKAVISDDVNNFTVRLERVSSGEVIVASLEDPLLSESAQKAISRAEWSAKPVMVHISARQVGDQIKDARITKAFTPRKRK